MKKFALIAFSIFYLTIISGVNLNMHYCSGKLISISIAQTSNEIGCCGVKKSSKGCCHDQSTFIKLKEKHVQSSDLKMSVNIISSVLITSEFNVLINEVTSKSEIATNYHAPPPNYKIPLFIKNRVLVI
jgi:hypothetical protein